LTVLRLCHEVQPDNLVITFLSEFASREPVGCVQALELMIDGDKEGWAMYGWGDNPRAILKTALESGKPEARTAAERTVHLLGARGQFTFRDLLKPQAH